jgi:predicted TIM-barrel fold metal-dependent hydrolase
VRRIDIHHHLIEEEGYAEALLREMDRHGIERTGLIGLGPLFRGLFVRGRPSGTVADNRAVEGVVRQHPDRLFGLGYLRPGDDPAERVDELADRGFRGLKFHVPRRRYDDEAYLPIYERAQARGLPCLFHAGVVTLPQPHPEERIASSNMEPIHLEAVAQAFPQLPLIIAHLGMQSYLTALTLIRILPNVYADLSGNLPGWRANLSPADWQRLLWFPAASQKLLFGTDLHCADTGPALAVYESICDAAGWGETERQRLYFGNAATLFGFPA